MEKLNIGCGNKKLPNEDGWINLDISAEVNPDKVCNIEEGLPYPDNHFDEIYSSHSLEHIRPYYWKFVINEIGRVCKQGARVVLDLPFDNIGTRTNADHFRTFSFGSFDQYVKGSGYEYYLDGFAFKEKNNKPPRIVRCFYYLFPIFKHNVRFEFEVVKRENEKTK